MTSAAAPRRIVNPVIRDTVTFLDLASETGGRSSLVQIELAAGGQNEAHYHRSYDETFTCVDGTLGVERDGRRLTLAPGETATVKAGEVHRFYNPSPDRPVTFQVLITPGAPGFERMLQVAYGLAADGLTNAKGVPKDPSHTALIIRWGDTNMPGLLSLLEPLFRWLARRAEANGTAQALVNRYCRF